MFQRNILLTIAILFSANTIAESSHLMKSGKLSQPWIDQALKLQREIDMDAPLSEATFIGTHNSYNAKSYEIPLIRYIDPNQILSIDDQLNMGVRSIELDAHWTLTSHASRDILLCHGQSNHLGCSVFDRRFTEGLEELRDWLKANPNEIVLLYIELHLDGHEPRLAAQLDEYLGEFIFKPNVVRKDNNTHACVALPTSLTKADVLRAGKQLLIVTKGCSNPNAQCEEQNIYQQNINDYVFAGIGDIPTQPFTFIDATVDSFTSYPDCGKSTVFHPDINHTSLWRIYEDRTILTNILQPNKKLEAEDMQALMRCGNNWPTMDMLEAGDSRLNAAIWSWAPNYPHDGQGECAVYKNGEGMKNMPCNQSSMGYACREETTHQIKAVTESGPWLQGESACQSFAGKNWHFAVPVNGQQLTFLKESMTGTLLQEVWLNYMLDSRGHWKANKI